MNLVFGAEGLTVGEGAFLMACCNHTDNRGYVIASMRQIRDEAHLGESAAKSNKKRLIGRGLLASAERYHPKNGARIADLYRVNIDALKQMQRKNVDYGPTVVEELTFGAPQENPSSAPRSESAGGGAESDGGGSESDGDAGSESDPHFLPSSVPSSLSGDPSVTPGAADPAEVVTEERESGASRGDDGPATALVPSQAGSVDAAVAEERLAEAAAFVAALPGRIGRASVLDLVPSILDAVAEGWTLPALGAFLSSRCDPSRALDPAAIYRKHLKDLPAPPAARSGAAARASQPPAVPVVVECDRGCDRGYLEMEDGVAACACLPQRQAAGI